MWGLPVVHPFTLPKLILLDEKVMRRGLIQVYTGDGKGKTTAAVGQAIRFLGRDYRVMMAQFLKEKDVSGEILILKKLGVKVLFWGGEYGRRFLANLPLDDIEGIRREGEDFLRRVMEEVKNKGYDLLILDEINVAMNYGLIRENEVLRLMRDKPVSLEVIMTGRRAPSGIISIADLITDMRKVKHPYDQGIRIRKGVEY